MPSLLTASPHKTAHIPVFDISDYLKAGPGVLKAAADQLRFALEQIGFSGRLDQRGGR
jgi:isopenicillin N synthase-like dioxygenase